MRARGLVSLVAALGVLVGGLALWAGVALASVTHPFVSSFGSGVLSNNVQGLAVDEASGAVYVFDANAGRIFKFNAAGEPAEFSALGSDWIEGLSAFGEAEDQLAVDNSPSGPAKGDIYLANGSSVKIFGSDGSLLGELNSGVTELGGPWEEPCGVAVDSTGRVFVGFYSRHVSEYTPGVSNPVSNADYTASIAGAPEVCNVAVDEEGGAYASTWKSGPVTHYTGFEFTALEQPGSVVPGSGGAARTLVVDPLTKDLYLDRGGDIAQLGAAGEALGTTGGFGPGAFSSSNGLAVNGAADVVYASDNGAGQVDVFGPQVTLADPVTGGVSGLTTSGATLEGTVDPNGIEASCQFEYGTDTSYGHVAPCSSAPGSGSGAVPVSASITGLAANTTYHYRLDATNANGVNYGRDVRFTTLSPPIVRSEYAASVSVSTATVDAKVNPMGFDTTYHFEYGPSTAYGVSVPVPDADVSAGGDNSEAGDVLVSQRLAGLQPAMSYHYRVVASNANGTTVGPDRVFTTFASPPAVQADTCPNAQFRTGPSAGLPDCRAYEMVSPLDKNGSDTEASAIATVAAVSGDRVSYGARGGFGESSGSGLFGITQYVASRGVDGWSSRGVTPTPPPTTEQVLVATTDFLGFSEELDRGVVEAYDLPGLGDDIPEAINLYREETASGSLQTLTTPLGSEPVGFQAMFWALRSFSGDLGVVTFETSVNLLPQAVGGGRKLYVWDHGSLRLAVLPDGSVPAGGSRAPREGLFGFYAFSEFGFGGGAGGLADFDAVSSDGSRVLFVSPADGSAAPQLYMRRDASNTVWVSRSEASSPDPEPQNVMFHAASRDGRRVLFSSSDRLLDSDPGGPGVGIYLFTDSPNPEAESNLRFIARVQNEQKYNHNEFVAGMSEDASRIYFFSEAGPGFPVEGTYLWDNGNVHFVTEVLIDRGSARVSDDGRRIAFLRLGGGMSVYDEARGALACASCPPSGAAPMSNAGVIPQANAYFAVPVFPYRPRFLSRDGRFVFFSTADALVPQDTNGVEDVYEYDVDAGRAVLLSSGKGDEGAWFADASADGSDVFFFTRGSLVAGDTDRLVDLYDARVGGGLPQPEVSATGCVGDACQGALGGRPSLALPSTFSGPGNPVSGTRGAAKKAKAKAKRRKGHAKRRKAKRRKRLGKRASRRIRR